MLSKPDWLARHTPPRRRSPTPQASLIPWGAGCQQGQAVSCQMGLPEAFMRH